MQAAVALARIATIPLPSRTAVITGANDLIVINDNGPVCTS